MVNMKKGFVFSIIGIAITIILLGYALFYFNYNDKIKSHNLNLEELRKVNYTIDDISSNLNNILENHTYYAGNQINFIFNMNSQHNSAALTNMQNFYNTTYNSLIGKNLKVDLYNIINGKTTINFNDSNFKYDYNNSLISIIPNSDMNYYIKLNVPSYSTSRTNWSFGPSGTYVTLDYFDYNYSYKQSGYINSSQNCNTNYFTLNYGTDKLTIDICKYNSINGSLVIDDNILSTYNIDANIIAYTTKQINNPYYYADLNYTLGNTTYIGNIPTN